MTFIDRRSIVGSIAKCTISTLMRQEFGDTIRECGRDLDRAMISKYGISRDQRGREEIFGGKFSDRDEWKE